MLPIPSDVAPKKKEAKTYRWWIITWNNPDVDWEENLKSLQEKYRVDYCIGQLEKGANGTPHIQAALYIADPVRGSHWGTAPFYHKGVLSAEGAYAIQRYCQKLDTRVDGPFTYGTSPVISRVNYDAALELAKEGRIYEITPRLVISNYVNLKKIAHDHTTARTTDNVRGIWIWGPPGSGKSHYARTLAGNEKVYVKAQNKWFDGYTGQSFILLDDFDDGGSCLGHYLKIWTDKWGCSGEVKGGNVSLMHNSFVITSNYLPCQWYKDVLLQAVVRRFKFIQIEDRQIVSEFSGLYTCNCLNCFINKK